MDWEGRGRETKPVNEVSSGPRTRIGWWLVLLSWVVGAGPLNLGVEREQGHVMAGVLFLFACVLWFVGRNLVVEGRSRLQTFALVVPALWFLNLIIAEVVGVLYSYRAWFPVVALFMVGAVVASSQFKVARRHGVTPRKAGNISTRNT
jgi:hypothetical protein